MGSPSELSLDYKPNTYPLIQKPVGDQPDHTQKLEDFLARLEEERLKIEAFKRELPLCMQLLNNAMETYRQQLETYQSNQGPRPVLEEFIPFSNMTINGSEKASTAPSEKASWMVSAQLWSPPSDGIKQQVPITAPIKEQPDRTFDVSPKLALDAKQRNGGAFHPFSKEKNKGSAAAVAAPRALPELALASSGKETEAEKQCGERESGSKSACHDQQGKGGGNSGDQGPAAAQSTHRKARRCWSPDLHRRFVNALQVLGGSQVATPKQIRELMKVDGLTNDEVKSHLQKYRLHTRRPIPPPQPTATAAPQLVVLGGIWVPPEYATSSAGGGPTIYGTHPATPHYTIPQDFYPPPPPLPHHLHHHLHRAAAPTAPTPYRSRISSPDSELRSTGDRSESIEEEDEGEEREEEEIEGEDEDEDRTEESKADDKALVPIGTKAADNGGGCGDVALKF